MFGIVLLLGLAERSTVGVWLALEEGCWSELEMGGRWEALELPGARVRVVVLRRPLGQL